ncbi:unnamed protein product [Rotaria sordida]|uniref:Uncharacterized protein n=1 Tax=Rotaria sordida TaxID=392033 RepID=A0A814W2U0_9BILA|nr:unnamed protein product [Rotaria sordida]CAF3711737.1 unnamed protein product [Rotaria sordida]
MVIAHTPVELVQIKKLLYAVRTSDYNEVRRICEKGIDGIINYNNPIDGETPLLVAVKKNDEIMMQYLLDLGANPNVTDFKGRTPLMRAAEHGFVEAVQTLLNANAKTNIRDLNGHDILFACLSDDTLRQQECFSIIMSKRTPDVNGMTTMGKPILVAACENGVIMEKICMTLLERGADANAIDRETGTTALHAACASGSVKVVRELLQRNANVNARDIHQRTPSHAAITSKVFELLPILSAYNARFDLADELLNTPVHLAAMLNQGKAIKFMVQRGGTTKTKNANNQLPIKIATIWKNKDAKTNIRLVEKKQYNRKIISSKSNPDRDYRIHLYDWLQERYDRLLRRFHQIENINTHRITSNDFKQIIHEEGFTQITSDDLHDLIIRHETNPNEIDYQTFLTGKLFIEKPFLMQTFIQKTNKKKKKKMKKTKKQLAIPIAIRHEGSRTLHGNPPLVYIKKHEFITDQNRFNRDHIPKHIINDDSVYYIDKIDPQFVHINNAVYRGDLHTLLDAFKSGVPVDIRDKFYKTPLMIAAANGDLETTKFLLQCGANVHLEDHFKWTALHHAANSGQLGVVRALVDAGAKINHESLTLATPLSRAIESSSLDIVNYLIEKNANVRHENITQHNLLDLAADFASPQIFNTIRTIYEQKGNKKDNQQSKSRRKPGTNTKKSKNVEMPITTIKPVKLEVPSPRRGSLLVAEEKLLSSNDTSESITYHPLIKWTDQPTTKELLDKKINLRNQFTMNIDFPDYKPPLLANAQVKLERLEVFDRRSKTS